MELRRAPVGTLEPRAGSRPRGPAIRVSRGAGSGPTRLAAFDGALAAAGVADFNLVRLSSVIPPGATVAAGADGTRLPGGFGDVLYCVYAEAYASTPGETTWAGLAWTRREADGAGLFVEQHGATEALLLDRLHATVGNLAERRGGGFGPTETMTASARCTGPDACALVVAAYRTAGWVP